MNFLKNKDNVIDIGCGASKVIQNMAEKSIGLDIAFNKLSFLKNKGIKPVLIYSDCNKNLPFKDEYFDTVILSNVIEHLSDSSKVISEINRVLKKGGVFIISTPDYSTLMWNLIGYIYEHLIPFAYGSAHITKYTFKSLKCLLSAHNFRILDNKYICGAEIIIKSVKEN